MSSGLYFDGVGILGEIGGDMNRFHSTDILC